MKTPSIAQVAREVVTVAPDHLELLDMLGDLYRGEGGTRRGGVAVRHAVDHGGMLSGLSKPARKFLLKAQGLRW